MANLMDVITSITTAGCEARVKRTASGSLNVDAWRGRDCIASTACWPDGGLHDDTLAEFVADLADPGIWASLGLEMPAPEPV